LEPASTECLSMAIGMKNRVDRLFATRRGLGQKQADFFLCELAEFADKGAVPFVKKLPGHKSFSIPSD
jgi:hypothetical protein